MKFRGRLELSLMDLSCAWRVQDKIGAQWKLVHYVTWANANMSLVGSTGGSGTVLVEFCPDGQHVDVHLCNMMDTTSYERYQIKNTPQHVQQLASCTQSDITGFLHNPQTHVVEAVTYNYEKPTLAYLDDCPDDVKRDIVFLQNKFSDASISIVSRTLDDQTWLVHIQSDVGLSQCLQAPSGYFVVNRNQKDGQPTSFKFLLSGQSALANYPLGTMTPVHIPTRDGKDLLCYLSRPPHSQQSPLVMLIHGGPQARDEWQFHSICQLLVGLHEST